MTLNPGANPYALFTGLDGRPLNGGKVYIGVAGQDPETHPQDIFWDEDGATPANNPMDTQAGYIWNAGGPARFWTQDTAFSIRARDRLGRQVFYDKNVTFEIPEGTVLPPGSVTADALPNTPADLDAIFSKLQHLQPGTGGVYFFIKDQIDNVTYPEKFGAKHDGTTDDAPAFQAALTWLKSKGGGVLRVPRGAKSYFGSTVSLPADCSLIGDGARSVEISTDQDIPLLGFDSGSVYNIVSGLYLRQQNASWSGIGIKARNVSYARFYDMRIEGFSRGVYLTQGLWQDWNGVQAISCNVGFDLKDIENSPLPFWNSLPDGWWNNNLTFNRCVADGGGLSRTEIGWRVQGMGLTMLGCTSQRAGEGYGIAFQFLGNLDRTDDPARGFTVIQPYVEGAKQAFDFQKVRNADMRGGFVQNSASSTVLISASDSIIRWESQPYLDGEWPTRLALTNTTFTGTIGGAGALTQDAASRYIPTGRAAAIVAGTSGTVAGGSSYTLTSALPNQNANYVISVGITYDGAPFETQQWSGWVAPNGTLYAQNCTPGATRTISLSRVGSDLRITNGMPSSMILRVTVECVSALAYNG